MLEHEGVTLQRYLADCDKAIVALKEAIRDGNELKRNKLRELKSKVLFRGQLVKEVSNLELQAINLADRVSEIKRLKTAAKRTAKKYEARKKKEQAASERRRIAQQCPDADFCVYNVELNHEVYIGITNNFSRRFAQHLNNSHNPSVRSMVERGAKPVIRFQDVTEAEARGIESGLIRAARSEGKLVHNQTDFDELP